MYSIKNAYILLCCICVLKVGCGESEKRSQTKLKIERNSALDMGSNGNQLDMNQNQGDPDVSIVIDASAVQDAGVDPNMEDMSVVDQGVQPDAAPEQSSRIISELSVMEWAQFCTRMTGAIESSNVSDEDLKYGYCVGQYNAVTEDYFSSTAAECGGLILECVEDLDTEHQLPLAICANTEMVPEECTVDVDLFDSCLRRLLEHQSAMGFQDVCSPELDQVAAFRRTFQLYGSARTCLTELASECAAINFE